MSIVVPVHGFAVPFHINTIKNVSKLDEGEFTYLRINFQSPGQLTGRKEDTVSSHHSDTDQITNTLAALRGPRRNFHSFSDLSFGGHHSL
jgi:nucleosome binding factor SPN SPT16 subunit